MKPRQQRESSRNHKRGRIRPAVILGLCALCASTFILTAVAAPAWWSARNVLNTEPADDYAAINQGQLKHIAAQAAAELNASLTGGAGSTINGMISSWSTPGASTDDYAVVNIGQLKTVAQPFYDRLIAAGYTDSYPWSATISDDDDYATANIGQVKHLFSFDLTADGENSGTGDGLPDWWEQQIINADPGDSITTVDHVLPGDDFDRDGLSNADEYAAGTDPTDPLSNTLLPLPFTETFETYTDGEAIAGLNQWQVSGQGSAIAQSTEVSATGGSLAAALNPDADQSIELLHQFTPTSGEIWLSFEAQVQSYSPTAQPALAATTAAGYFKDSQNRWHIYDGTTSTWKAAGISQGGSGPWHTITMRLDYGSNQHWDLYIDGYLLARNTTFANALSQFESFKVTAVGGPAYLDNLNITTAKPSGIDDDNDGLADAWETLYFGDLTTADAGTNSDSDGLLDIDEQIAGLDPTKSDTDGDGISDSKELADGTNPSDATDFTATPLPYTETFEAYADGELLGSDNWLVTGEGTAAAQSAIIANGSRALQLTAATGQSLTVSQRFDGTGHNEVWVDQQLNVTPYPAGGGAPAIDSTSVAAYYFTTDGLLHVYNGTTSQWQSIDPAALNLPDISINPFDRVTLRLDYSQSTWDIYLYGILVAADLGFYSSQSSFSAYSITGQDGSAYLDDLSITTTEPANLGDGDSLPDAWEQLIVDFDPNDTIHTINDVLPADDFDGDGIDNLTEYQNGTDPTVNPGVGYHMNITLDGYTGSETLTNFPVLVKLNTSLNGFNYSQFLSSAGHDLRISDSNHHPLSYEIETWDPTGDSYIWVQVPSLAPSGTATVIYARWGNPAESTQPSYASDGSVWQGQGYQGVWHLTDAADSTAGQYDGTINGTAVVPGKIGSAQDYEGADSIALNVGAFATITDNVTLELWQYGDSSQPKSDTIISGTASGSRQLSAHLPWHNGRVYWDAFGGYDRISKVATAADYKEQWNHWVFQREAGTMRIYLNGALWHSGTGKTKTYTPVNTFTLGAANANSHHYDGIIDEFRVSDTAHSADWILATYQSAADPHSFAAYSNVAGNDADNDGLPDDWEALYGLSTSDDGTTDINNGPDGDPDGDHWSNLEEYQNGTDPTVSQATALPFTEDFESYTLNSDLNGQNGWIVTGDGTATVTDTQVSEGSQSLELTANSGQPTAAIHTFDATGINDIWVDMQLIPAPYAASAPQPTLAATTAAGYYFSDDGLLHIYNGTTSQWVTVNSGSPVTLTALQRLTLQLDYTAKTFDLYLDEALLADDFGFANNTLSQFQRLTIGTNSGTAYADEITVGVVSPLSAPPVFEVRLGDNQTGNSLEYLEDPLVIFVKDDSDHALVGIPVTFEVTSVASGTAALSDQVDGTESQILSTVSDEFGEVKAYVKMPDGFEVAVEVTVTADAYSAVSHIFHLATKSDQVAPTVSLTSPVTDESVLENRTMTLQADATDEDGTVIKVEFYVDGAKVGEDTDDSDGWSFDWLVASSGAHTAYAIATDDGGKSVQSTAVNFTGLVNTDSDALPDDWEMLYFGDLDEDETTDPDGDGFNNSIEYADGDVESGTDPADFYDGQAPVVSIISGNNQSAQPGEVLAVPLEVRVMVEQAAKHNAPVIFSVVGGEALLLEDAAGTAQSSFELRTVNGEVSLLAQAPAGFDSSAEVEVYASGYPLYKKTFAISSDSQEVVATPEIDISGGRYTVQQEVTVTCATPGAQIHYTLDGNEPTESAPFVLSGEVILVQNSGDLAMRAYKTNAVSSELISHNFVLTGSLANDIEKYLLKTDQSLWKWSDGSIYLPQKILDNTNFIEIISGRAFSGGFFYALDDNKEVWAWGANSQGHLGLGHTNPVTLPEKSTLLSNINQLDAGEDFSIALDANGEVWVWGTDQIIATSTTPYKVTGLTDIEYISAGYRTACAIKSDGTVYFWGYDTYTIPNGNSSTGVVYTPTAVNFNSDIKRVSFASNFGLALAGNGDVYGWGRNVYDQLLHDPDNSNFTILSPQLLVNMPDANEVVAGTGLSIVLTGNGEVYAKGAIHELFTNQNSGFNDHTSFVKGAVEILRFSSSSQFGSYYVPVLTPQGLVMNMHVNTRPFSLGVDKYPEPGAFELNYLNHVIDMETDLILKSDGRMYPWGRDVQNVADYELFYQDGATSLDDYLPVYFTPLSYVLPDLENIRKLQRVSYSFPVNIGRALALSDSGILYEWGRTEAIPAGSAPLSPQVLLSDVADFQVPDVYDPLSSFLVLKTDGTVLENTTGSFNQLLGIDLISQISNARYHRLALTDSGEVYSWGSNSVGQLGDGTNSNRVTPTKISGLSTIQKIHTNAAASFAIGADGTLWSWGSFSISGRPIDDPVAHNIPNVVPGVGKIGKLVVSERLVIAYGLDDTVYAWGDLDNDLGYSLATSGFAGVTELQISPQDEYIRKITSIKDIHGARCLILNDGTVRWVHGSYGLPQYEFQDRSKNRYAFIRTDTTDDTDEDQLMDSWELEHFPDLSSSREDDPDGDGYANFLEYIHNTDPNNADSDADGVSDSIDEFPNDPYDNKELRLRFTKSQNILAGSEQVIASGFEVEVLSREGTPLVGKEVTFITWDEVELVTQLSPLVVSRQITKITNSSGLASITLKAPLETGGQHRVSVVVEDSSGSKITKLGVVEVFDNGLEVEISNLSDNAILSNSPVSITAAATVAIGDISEVNFYVNDTLLSADTSDPYTADWLPSGDGNHVLYVTAESSGIVVQSGNIMVTYQSSLPVGDVDGNGLPDTWEQTHFSGTGVDPADDPDNDGLSNLAEYYANTDPNDNDDDGDGFEDGFEVRNGLDPKVGDLDGDLDGDGVPNKQDARPADPNVGILQMIINTPADGEVVN